MRLCEVIVQSIQLAVEEVRVLRSGLLSSGSPLYSEVYSTKRRAVCNRKVNIQTESMMNIERPA